MPPLVTVAQMRALEQQANARGWTYADMMEAAGRGLAEVVRDLYAAVTQRTALGLVGKGNNGGDTLVALAHLAEWGWEVSAYLVRPREGDPLVERVRNAGGRILHAGQDDLDDAIAGHEVLLDGVLGTGVRLPLREDIARILAQARDAAQRYDVRVVAVDAPSGVDCDTGQAAEETIPADDTVTMAAIKVGLVLPPGLILAGDLHVVDIGLPEDLPAWREITREVPDADRVREILPPRPADAHKGTFGTALVVAGSVNFTGAARLAGEAAYRIGAGLVTLGIPAPLHPALAGTFPEATWLLLPDDLGVIADRAADVVLRNLDRVTAMLLGPGFGQEETTRDFLARLLRAEAEVHPRVGFIPAAEPRQTARPQLPPLVIDADGLKLLTRIAHWPEHVPGPAVLTPHPGEMAVLTGLSTREIQAQRLTIAERFAQMWGHVVVLKGAGTVIAAPDGRTAVIPVATPALARAGTGDVLAGLIVGLRAQGVPAYEAALAGAWIHAQAGLIAAETVGHPAAVLAGDVLRAVPDVLMTLG
ncbi:MAG: NAD(P)H-hydrate dehydratase [Chloroflexi bacterium]|nr:NAD(P)H-hydrate dehydratase [Chloroflexota bacterium]